MPAVTKGVAGKLSPNSWRSDVSLAESGMSNQIARNAGIAQ